MNGDSGKENIKAISDKVAAIKEGNIEYLESRNQNKDLKIKDGKVSFTTRKVGMFGQLPDEIPYVKDSDNYVVNENGDKRIDLKKLVRYTLSQLIPSKAKKEKLEDLKALGLQLPEDGLNADQLALLQSENPKDKDDKDKLVEDLLKEYFDEPHKDKEVNVTLPLTEEYAVVDLECVERGRVTVDSETYISNVMRDGDGRNKNLNLASEAFALQRLRERYGDEYDSLSETERKRLLRNEKKEVKDWMEVHGYTWHEIDDKANMEKVPTHLHACIFHEGGVSLVQKKYENGCYQNDFQQRVADSALERAVDIRNKKFKEYIVADKACNHDVNNKELKETLAEYEKAEQRVSLLRGNASEKKLAELNAKGKTAYNLEGMTNAGAMSKSECKKKNKI